MICKIVNGSGFSCHNHVVGHGVGGAHMSQPRAHASKASRASSGDRVTAAGWPN